MCGFAKIIEHEGLANDQRQLFFPVNDN